MADPKSVVRRMVEEVMNRGRLDAIDEQIVERRPAVRLAEREPGDQRLCAHG